MWIVPSVCGRAQLAPLIDAGYETAMTAPLGVLFDIRDGAAGLYPPPDWRLIPAVGRVEAAECVRIAAMPRPAGETIGFLPADHVPLTPGWDRALERAAGRWNIAYCNDLVSAKRHPVGGADHLSGAVCFGGALADAVGPLIPAGMSLDDARIAWAALGRSLGALRYLKGVEVEWRRERAAAARVPGRRLDPDRRARLFRWLNDELRPLARRLREVRAADAVSRADESCAV